MGRGDKKKILKSITKGKWENKNKSVEASDFYVIGVLKKILFL